MPFRRILGSLAVLAVLSVPAGRGHAQETARPVVLAQEPAQQPEPARVYRVRSARDVRARISLSGPVTLVCVSASALVGGTALAIWGFRNDSILAPGAATIALFGAVGLPLGAVRLARRVRERRELEHEYARPGLRVGLAPLRHGAHGSLSLVF